MTFYVTFDLKDNCIFTFNLPDSNEIGNIVTKLPRQIYEELLRKGENFGFHSWEQYGDNGYCDLEISQEDNLVKFIYRETLYSSNTLDVMPNIAFSCTVDEFNDIC